ncbi:MAG TPA: prolyl oligopeptidase family serine peptidase [Gemmatimonadaceae bacterium]|nr:prolyl oligopeptidase family serine peptidase [Gemmatimonadaceae bacterium]
MRSRLLALLASLALATPVVAQQRVQYPQTKTVDVVDDYHGTKVGDPYRWLEDLNSPETAEWVKAENDVTNAYLATLPNREQIRKRITELWNYPRVSTPYWEGGHWFYSRNSGLQRQSVIYMRDALNGPERIALDPNTLSPDGSIALSGFVPSPDGKRIAYGQSEGGADWTTYYVRELGAGKQTTDTVRWVRFSGVSWTHDGKGFFYGRYPEPKEGQALVGALRDRRIYYHVIGTPQSADRLIYERPDDPELFTGVEVDESGRYLLVYASRGTSPKNELYIADMGNARTPNVGAPIRPIYTGHDAEYSPLGIWRGVMYLQTDRDAPRRKIISVPLAKPAASNWKTLVPETKNVIEGASMVAGRIAVRTLEDVASVIRIYNLAGRVQDSVALPGLGTASTISGRFERPEMFYSFTSPLYPTTVFRYDSPTRRSRPFEKPQLKFDPTKFETKRVFYPSKDGTRVPMFITHRKGLVLDGSNPTMLYAYGGFNISTLPGFSSHVPMWLEMGGVWATANLRGGGEYGEEWHQAGMFEKKQNVFDDFIAAAEYLIREKYTSPSKLAIQGGSNGGLLVGAMLTQRPDLFAAALPAVGVMDMLRFHKFTGGKFWTVEYGSADDSTAFKYLRAYSPLQNIKPGTCYPATLVTTADHDDRVVPSHSFKFTAEMQKAQGCDKPVLIRVETQGSHGYRPTDKRIAELTDQWAFTAQNLGVSATTPVTP